MRTYTRTQNTNFKLFASDTMGIQANTTQTHRRMYTSTNSSEGEKGQWSYDIYLFRFKNLVLLLYISFIPWQAVKPRLFERITFSSLKCTQKLFEIANYQIYTCGFVKWLMYVPFNSWSKCAMINYNAQIHDWEKCRYLEYC